MAGLTAVALAALGAELALAYRAPAAAPGDRAAAANAALVARLYAELGRGDRPATVAELVADDHIYHDPAAPGVAPGPDGVGRLAAALRRAFPDGAVAVDDVVARGDRVAVRFTARGTHRGEVLGAAATGRSVVVTGVAVHRVAHRQVAETWVSWDAYGVAEQVGLFLLPAPADGWEGAPGRTQPIGPH
jgi:steroid delta-isomerase-like uncharacterized protein